MRKNKQLKERFIDLFFLFAGFSFPTLITGFNWAEAFKFFKLVEIFEF